MSWLLILSAIGFFAAFFVAVQTLRNLAIYAPAPVGAEPPEGATLAVCIPARNEEGNIEDCVRAVLASELPGLRCVVYDDESTDRTTAILQRLQGEDDRLVICPTTAKPADWNGKQWACSRMCALSFAPDTDSGLGCSHALLIDADVRLSPDAPSRALAAFADADARVRTLDGSRGLGLLSTFPRQVTRTLSEHLAVPMIFFLLFGYLPMRGMRRSLQPSMSAACGQFMLVGRDAYAESGGHEPFKDSMHDGVKMPRAIRRAGYSTDLFNGTDLASCRMYRGLVETWRGFAKNAYEGLGSVALLVFLTVAHGVGHILPPIVVVWSAIETARGGEGAWLPGVIALAAIVVAVGSRLAIVRTVRHSAVGVALHPVAVAMMTAIQWHSFVLHVTGRRSWRGRTQGQGAGPTGSSTPPATPAA